MAKRFAVVLAAGQGTRMKSKLYKVLHPVVGRPMVQHVINQLEQLQIDEMVTIVGYGAEKVIEKVGSASKFVTQEEQLGTGHAVQQAEALLLDKDGTTIVVCGDTPLITKETYKALFDHHEKEGSKATILTAKAPDPTGYGRIIRNDHNQVERIVEQKDANKDELLVDEINTGTYCFDNKALFEALNEVSNDNAQGEYYLPDVIEILRSKEEKVSAFLTSEFEETIGINDRVALAQAEKVMKKRINLEHMRNGVTIIDPDNTYIGPDVEIEQDVIIYPGSMVSGKTIIHKNAEIGPHTEITDCVIGESASITQSVLIGSQVGNDVTVGPYAYIRPETNVGNKAKIGHFVELKKSIIGENSKIPHLSYVGDAEIGRNVNVGCGTITVNYDGKGKHTTKIEDDAFIGCNTNLVAPVSIGEGAYVAAGSTITKNVPNHSLSVARARQTNKEGYASRFKK
jgi:bifunctional UDP-N-acetylglucosamine pyrophosphorylase/glucosamine-1-phosphate N-acetyltransferase